MSETSRIAVDVEEMLKRGAVTSLDAFVEAAGGMDYADLDSLKIIRSLGRGKKKELAVDLARIMKKADLSQHLPLSPGDIVLVPR